jgi:hypothetical protein
VGIGGIGSATRAIRRGGKAEAGSERKAEGGKRACARACVKERQWRRWWCRGDVGGRLTGSGGKGGRGVAWVARQGTFLGI